MVIITTEKKARKIFERYRKVAAFTFGDKKGISDNGLEISYAGLSFLPGEDEINAVANGDVKAKTIIRKAVRALHRPADPDNKDICVSFGQLMNIVAPEKRESKAQNIIVFVLDDAEDARAKNKFLSKFICETFGEFGVKVICDKKDVKRAIKLFKGKIPAKARKEKKQRARYAEYVDAVNEFLKKNPEYRISKEGHRLKKVLMTYYSLELTQSSVSHTGIYNVSRKNRELMASELANVFSNDNLKSICVLGIKNKEEKKLCKSLVKKNKRAVDAYNDLRDIIMLAQPDAEIPKAKNAYKKKRRGKKKGTSEPRMKIKKFIKFMSKNRDFNVGFLGMVYTHITLMTLGVNIGSREYNKYLSVPAGVIGEEFAQQFTQAAKTWAKENSNKDKDSSK